MSCSGRRRPRRRRQRKRKNTTLQTTSNLHLWSKREVPANDDPETKPSTLTPRHTTFLKPHSQTIADFNKATAYRDQVNYQYAIERPRQTIPLKAVIRKLPMDTPPDDIMTEHLAMNFTMESVAQMCGRSKHTREK